VRSNEFIGFTTMHGFFFISYYYFGDGNTYCSIQILTTFDIQIKTNGFSCFVVVQKILFIDTWNFFQKHKNILKILVWLTILVI